VTDQDHLGQKPEDCDFDSARDLSHATRKTPSAWRFRDRKDCHCKPLSCPFAVCLSVTRWWCVD